MLGKKEVDRKLEGGKKGGMGEEGGRQGGRVLEEDVELQELFSKDCFGVEPKQDSSDGGTKTPRTIQN